MKPNFKVKLRGKKINMPASFFGMSVSLFICIFACSLLNCGEVFQKGDNEKMNYFESQEGSCPNFLKNKNSPIFVEDENGVKINFADRKLKTKFRKNEPWVMFGAYQVGSDILGEFGNNILDNIWIVVINKESNAIFSGRLICNKDPVSKSGNDTFPSGGKQISEHSYFNIDLKQYLIPDSAKGKFWVVALLCNLASSVLEFEVESSEK